MDNPVSLVFKVANPETEGIEINPAYDHLEIHQ
jgi:hypothetical protein